MKVIMLTAMSGPGVEYALHGEYEIDNEEATRLITKGFAKPLRNEEPERAVKTNRATSRRKPKR